MSARGPVLAVVLALSTSWLAGCGGGGDEAVDPSTSSPTAPSTTPSTVESEGSPGSPQPLELRVVRATSEAPAADSMIRQQLEGLDCAAEPTPAPATDELVTCDDAGVGYVLEPTALVAEVETAEAVAGTVGDEWTVVLQLAADDATALGELTAGLAATGSRLAVVVDSRVVSAPTVEGPVRGGGLVVAGDFDETQATALAERLGGAG